MPELTCSQCGGTRWRSGYDDRIEYLYAVCTTCGHEETHLPPGGDVVAQIEQPESAPPAS